MELCNYIIPCLAADFCACIFHVTLGYKDFDCFSHNIVCYMYSNIHTCNLKCMPNKLHVIHGLTCMAIAIAMIVHSLASRELGGYLTCLLVVCKLCMSHECMM